MLTIKNGLINDPKVKVHLVGVLSHGNLKSIDAIVLHQTDSDTAESTLAKYAAGSSGTGAHFLIGKDGTIYQTLSISKKAWHVGKLRSRCLETHSCAPDEKKVLDQLAKTNQGHYSRFVSSVNRREMQKKYPQRYPGNDDAIGIEIVGKSLPDGSYEKLTAAERASSQWLISGLLEALKLTRTDVYRHPEVSYKQKGEAADAVW
jgi:N-acetyl-anhydromuramyl-L-alanine amidase AmpD